MKIKKRLSNLENKLIPEQKQKVGVFYKNDPKWEKKLTSFRKDHPEGLAVTINYVKKPMPTK